MLELQLESYKYQLRLNKTMPSKTNVLYVTGSLTLTLATIAVGISFFGPYWLSNISATVSNSTEFTGTSDAQYIEGNVVDFPHRGLWAQCGQVCKWFWQDGYMLQIRLLTPLKWHLATQILYFIASILILSAEIIARIRLCYDRHTIKANTSLSLLVYTSALIQTAALATFGGGACRAPYWAVSNPAVITPLLGQKDEWELNPITYIGWCYWMALTGDVLTVMAGSFFMIAACTTARNTGKY